MEPRGFSPWVTTLTRENLARLSSQERIQGHAVERVLWTDVRHIEVLVVDDRHHIEAHEGTRECGANRRLIEDLRDEGLVETCDGEHGDETKLGLAEHVVE